MPLRPTKWRARDSPPTCKTVKITKERLSVPPVKYKAICQKILERRKDEMPKKKLLLLQLQEDERLLKELPENGQSLDVQRREECEKEISMLEAKLQKARKQRHKLFSMLKQVLSNQQKAFDHPAPVTTLQLSSSPSRIPNILPSIPAVPAPILGTTTTAQTFSGVSYPSSVGLLDLPSLPIHRGYHNLYGSILPTPPSQSVDQYNSSSSSNTTTSASDRRDPPFGPIPRSEYYPPTSTPSITSYSPAPDSRNSTVSGSSTIIGGGGGPPRYGVSNGGAYPSNGTLHSQSSASATQYGGGQPPAPSTPYHSHGAMAHRDLSPQPAMGYQSANHHGLGILGSTFARPPPAPTQRGPGGFSARGGRREPPSRWY